jgi:hypothetical protein
MGVISIVKRPKHWEQGFKIRRLMNSSKRADMLQRGWVWEGMQVIMNLDKGYFTYVLIIN